MVLILKTSVRIVNKRGLHARAAAKFVKLVEELDAEVMVSKDSLVVTGASIMGLLMLSASIDTYINISVRGNDAERALAVLSGLVERGFDEE